MPTTETTPADGIGTIAAAQVLSRRNLVVRAADGLVALYSNFAPGGGDSAARNFRDLTSTQVNNLPGIMINLFLYPTYSPDNDLTIFRAQNNIEWRPVGIMPPDDFPSDTGLVGSRWLPLASPMILPVAVPVSFKCCCLGLDFVGVEVRIRSIVGLPVDQGQNRILVSISASS